MKYLNVAAAVLNQTPLDWRRNAANIREAIAQARSLGASILCLPELCITGYGCEDAFQSPSVHSTAWSVLESLLPETRGMIVSLGLPVWHGGGVYNCGALVVDSQLIGLVGKQNLAGDGIHYEPRWFKPWPPGVVSCVVKGDDEIPLGDLVFDCGGVRLGFEICEDAWVGHRPGADLAARNVDIILNPSASHFAFGKHQVRRRFVIEGSRAFHVSYLYANLVGNEAGRAVYDGDAMIATEGRIIACGDRFSFADVAVTDANIDIDATRMQRSRTGSYFPDIGRQQNNVVDVEFEYSFNANLEGGSKLLSGVADDSPADGWEKCEDVKEEEFTRAVSLAIFDYVRKSRSRGVVVSLSGGADSAACALLSALALEFAERSLSEPQRTAKLGYMSADSNWISIKEQWLTTAYQATRNSSDTTRNAAAEVAEAASACHLELDIDPLVEQYQSAVSTAIGRDLSWEEDDIALQNIQARVRAPSVWMIANLTGALLLATSNRSEAAVGYTTMDGDTCGGISPIAGIDKDFLRQWLRWMESTGPHGIGPFPQLRSVNVQEPTAELRPPGEGQTDETDLMPYDILDAIERFAIRDKQSPIEVWQRLCQATQHDASILGNWVIRFYRLWSRNQWKRERFAPSFHLDDENLDPKTWCRFPILSGGFEQEISELEEELRQ